MLKNMYQNVVKLQKVIKKIWWEIMHTFPSESSTHPRGNELADNRCDREENVEERPHCVLEQLSLFSKLLSFETAEILHY